MGEALTRLLIRVRNITIYHMYTNYIVMVIITVME